VKFSTPTTPFHTSHGHLTKSMLKKKIISSTKAWVFLIDTCDTALNIYNKRYDITIKYVQSSA